MRYKITNTSKNRTVTCTLGDKSSLYLYPKEDKELTEEQFTDYFYNVPFLTVEEVKDPPFDEVGETPKEQKKTNSKRKGAEENNEKED